MVAELHAKGYFETFSSAMYASELAGLFDLLFLRNVRNTNPYRL